MKRPWLWSACAALVCAHAVGAPQVVGSWLFNGESDGVAADEGPDHLDGRASNVQQVPGAGEEGLALRFSRPGAQVDMPPSGRYACSGGGFALALWVRTRQVQPGTILVLAEPATGAPRLRLSLTAGGRLQLELWAPLQPAVISRVPVADGDWHYVTAIYDAPPGQAFLYVDDAFSHCAPLPPGGPAEVALRLGNDFGADRPFRGDLDDITLTSGLTDEVRGALSRYRRWGEPPGGAAVQEGLPVLNLPATPPGGDDLRQRLDGLRESLTQWVGALPEATVADESEPVDLDDMRATPMTLQAGEVRVPAVMVSGAAEAEEGAHHPAVILADPEGKATVMEGRRGLLSALTSAEAVACAVDLSASPAAAARQLLAASAYLRARADVQPDALLLVCWGADAVPGLLAAACDPGLTRVVALNAAGEAVPSLAAALAPRPLWLQGPLQLPRLSWPVAAYRELAPGNLLISTDEVDAAEIIAWLPWGT